jgi:predicted dehydrogenase
LQNRRSIVTDQTLSRRSFLIASAAGAAIAMHGLSSHAAESATQLRWGIIGTGTRGGWTHVPVLKEAPGCEIAALCDVSDERLQTAVKRADREVETYADYQKLLANPNINCVVIATPNLLHREMLQAALQAGKHVLCEKPAGASPADAAEIERMAAAAKTVVMFGMQYRHNFKQKVVMDQITAGKIGKPKYIVQTVSRGDWNRSPLVWQYADPKLNGGKPQNWRMSQTASGGTLNEFSCHYLDLIHWMAGERPIAISGTGGIMVYKDGRDTWDNATVTMRYPSGLVAVHTLCLFGHGRNELVVYGDEGSLETKDDKLVLNSRKAKKGSGGATTVDAKGPEKHGADDSTLELYKDFLACVTTGKKPDADANRALTAFRTCWLSEQSSDKKAEIKWEELTARA